MAALALDILSDPVARIPAFGLRTPFDWPFRAAAKTGTSRHYTDNWAVATTGRFTVAVWVGNFSGQPMQGVSGVTGAGPLLHRAVLVTAQRYAPGDLIRPGKAEPSAAVAARVLRARTIQQDHFRPEVLARQIEALAMDPVALNNAAARALTVGRPHAAHDLADLVERVGNGVAPVVVGPALTARITAEAPEGAMPA